MVARTHSTGERLTQIGPRAWYASAPECSPVILHADDYTESATVEDVYLLSVLRWLEECGELATLFGVECMIDIDVRLSGRWYVKATLPCGQVRILETLRAVRIAESMIAPLEDFNACDLPF